MEIVLEDISKKYNNQWIFRHINLHLTENNIYAITGPNGSGKSTFISIISGFSLPTEGKLAFKSKKMLLSEDVYFKQVSIAAPYLELIEELTLTELIDFHFKFVPILTNKTKESLIEYSLLENSKHKPIRFFSSGMKQRLKLALALFTDKPILIFDEPTINLDEEGAKWYQKAVEELRQNRMLIISSNVPEEYRFTNNIVKISDYNV
ncbi:MAG: ATP-binding cassette domain-containing protein [Cytophagales bacterium]